jgi:hypothetical protein
MLKQWHNWVMALLVVAVARAALAAESQATADQNRDTVETKDKVLRHAVFFKFKDSATKADAQGVVDALRELPSKIKQIESLESGESIRKSGWNHGFTHCFLLTFKDEAGRAAYLPHPDHQAFGGALRPHLDKVFVVDYWGRPAKSPTDRALRHAVFCKFKEGASKEGVRAAEEGLAALPAKIDAVKAFEWGTNNSPEKHDEGFTHCFLFTFDSEEGLKEYADHPAHVAAARDLLPKVEAIRVLDFWADEVKARGGAAN